MLKLNVKQTLQKRSLSSVRENLVNLDVTVLPTFFGKNFLYLSSAKRRVACYLELCDGPCVVVF